MFKIISFITICLVSLGWIGWNAVELFQRSVELNPQFVFTPEDNEVLVINQIQETPVNDLPFELNNTQLNILQNFTSSAYVQLKRAYFSSSSTKVLVEIQDKWSTKLCERVFANFRSSPPLQKQQFGTFAWGKFNIYIDDNRLLIYEGKFTTRENQEKTDFSFDKNSNFSILPLNKKSISTSDYYIGEEANFSYVKTSSHYSLTDLVSDAKVFNAYLPKKFDSYTFHERDYLAQKDELFSSSVMRTWVNHGVVEIEFNNQPVLISDFLSDNDPINLLARSLNPANIDVENQTFESAGLCLDWKSKTPRKYHYRILDNYIYIALEGAILDQLTAQLKLGENLSNNPRLNQILFYKVPSAVHQRSWTNREVATVANSSKLTLTTKKIQKVLNVQVNDPKLAGSIQLSAKGKIAASVHFPNSNKTMIINEKNELMIYTENEITYTAELTAPLIGSIQIISISGVDHAMFASGNHIEVINSSGENATGFPIVLNANLAQEPSACNFSQGRYIAAPTTNNEVVLFNFSGRQMQKCKLEVSSIERPIHFWLSQNELYLGLQSENTFTMLHVKDNQTIREFDLPNYAQAIYSDNAIRFYHIEEEKVIRTDQKGNRLPLFQVQAGTRLYAQADLNIWGVIRDNKIEFFNLDERKIFEIERSDAADIDHIKGTLHNNQLYMALMNEISNDIHLYRSQFNMNIQKKGQGTIQWSTNPQGELFMTSPMENFLTIYPNLQ